MNKLRMDPNDLRVEAFQVETEAKTDGTILGAAASAPNCTGPNASCGYPYTCGGTTCASGYPVCRACG